MVMKAQYIIEDLEGFTAVNKLVFSELKKLAKQMNAQWAKNPGSKFKARMIAVGPESTHFWFSYEDKMVYESLIRMSVTDTTDLDLVFKPEVSGIVIEVQRWASNRLAGWRREEGPGPTYRFTAAEYPDPGMRVMAALAQAEIEVIQYRHSYGHG